MDSLADGIHKYTQTWYQLDQRYRKFVFHARESGQASLLQALNQKVENLYNNNYLSRLNVRWQQWVDSCQTWAADPVVSQSKFFSHFVQPYLDRKGKVCVLISDAFRYEIGEELQTLIRREDRFEAELGIRSRCLAQLHAVGHGRAAYPIRLCSWQMTGQGKSWWTASVRPVPPTGHASWPRPYQPQRPCLPRTCWRWARKSPAR